MSEGNRPLSPSGTEIILTKFYSEAPQKEENIMSLKITDRKADGVTVLELHGRIVLGEETTPFPRGTFASLMPPA